MTPPARQSHVADLDALRGIAIFGVVLTHVVNSLHLMGNDLPLVQLDLTQLLNSGGLGVQLFFLLSGFLLTITEGRRYAAGKASIRAYALRRFLRLAPAYYLSLVLYLIVGLWQGSYHPHISPVLDMAIYASFLHGLSTTAHSDLNPAYWSLTCEVVFYAALPLVLRYASSLRLRLSLYLATLGLAALVYYRFTQSVTIDEQLYYLFHPFAHLHLFLAGSILATLSERKARGYRLPVPAGTGDFLLLLALVGLMLNAYLNYPEPGLKIVSRLGGELLVTVAFASYTVGSPILHWALRMPGLAALGRISYSVFLFHGLFLAVSEQSGLLQWLRMRGSDGTPHLALTVVYLLIALGVTIPVCALSYACVEVPGMRGYRRTRPAKVLAAT